MRKSPLPMAWRIPQALRDRLGETAGRQRVMFADGHLLLVLHQAPRANEVHRTGRFFWRAPDGTWQGSAGGAGIQSLRKHLGEYTEALERLEKLEERADVADEYLFLLQQVVPLHRAAHHQYEVLKEARQMVPEDPELIVCRDQAYMLQRTAELLHTDVQNGLNCAMARRAEEQAGHAQAMARAGHRLNVLAAVFFPIATLGTIFGMNLPHGLPTEMGPLPFWLLLLGGVVAGFALKTAVIDAPGRVAKRDRFKRA